MKLLGQKNMYISIQISNHNSFSLLERNMELFVRDGTITMGKLLRQTLFELGLWGNRISSCSATNTTYKVQKPRLRLNIDLCKVLLLALSFPIGFIIPKAVMATFQFIKI